MSDIVQIGSKEHKELFCRSFVESFRVYEPQEWAWPHLDDISLARLRAVPIWTLALEVDDGSAVRILAAVSITASANFAIAGMNRGRKSAGSNDAI